MPAHLKEQDDFFELILARHALLSRSGAADPIAAAFAWAQALLESHAAATLAGSPSSSELSALVPSIGAVWLPLDFDRALTTVDARARLRARRFVPPSFAEVRRVVNEATVVAAAPSVSLLTLDADNTIYSDGGTLTFDAPIVPLLVRILRTGVRVAIVTAASYPGQPERFEARLEGLLAAASFAIEAGAPSTLLDNFWVMGGQCNYLLRARVDPATFRVFLEEVPGEQWKRFRGVRWDRDAVVATLDVAEAALRECIASLDLDVLLVRKERAVGVLPKNASGGRALSYEVLEELTLAAQEALATKGPRSVPTCAFNGGRDTFVDIGSKALGIRALQGLLDASPQSTVHVGDRFTRSGHDFRARDCASCLWVSSPRETCELLANLIPLLAREPREALSGAGAPSAPPLSIVAPRIFMPAPDSSSLSSRTPREAALKPFVMASSGGVAVTQSGAASQSGAVTQSASQSGAASPRLLTLSSAPPSTFRRTLEQRLAGDGHVPTGWPGGVGETPVSTPGAPPRTPKRGGGGSSAGSAEGSSVGVSELGVGAATAAGELDNTTPRSRGPGVSGSDRFIGFSASDEDSDASLLSAAARSQWVAAGGVVVPTTR